MSFGGRQVPFEIDPEIARRLLEGLDDIGVTLRQPEAIDALRGRARAQRAGHDRAGMSGATGTPPPTTASPTPQVEMAEAVLERLPLRGDETVLDAGLRLGPRHRAAARPAPAGHVVAVDSAPSMVEHAREALPPSARRSSARASPSSRSTSRSTPPSRTPCSTGSPTTSACSSACPRRSSPAARLVAQCGGKGNIDAFRRLADEVAAEPPYAEHMEDFGGPWNYASPEDTEARLLAAGFDEVRCWLQPWPVTPRRPARVRPHRLPRQPPRGAAGGAARALRGGGRAALGRAAGARVRAPQHRRTT